MTVVARLVYPAAIGILVIGYYTVDSTRPAVVATVGAVSVAAIVLGLVYYRPPRRGAWMLIALAVALLATGDCIFTVLAMRSPGPVSYPNLPDGFYLAAYVPLTVGLLWLGQPRLPSRDWPMFLDTVALSLVGSFLVWLLVVEPKLSGLDLSNTGNATAIGSWVGYVAVLAASVRVVLTWRANLALRMVGAGVVAFLISDVYYEKALYDRSWNTGSPVDLGYLAFSALCGGAALTPSMARISSIQYARHRIGPVRLTLLAVTLLVAPTALLVEATAGTLTTGVTIAAVSVAVVAVVLVRLTLTARAYRRRSARELAVRTASQTLVRAAAETDVVAALDRALAMMLPAAESGEVRLVDYGQSNFAGPTLLPRDTERAVAKGAGDIGDLTVPTREEAAAFVFTTVMAELVELSIILAALADHAASALDRIRLVDSLAAKERERYFRTLVLTSSDVTLISRHDRVTYATPSAEWMFGRDVQGERFPVLVRRSPQEGGAPRGSEDPVWTDVEDGAEGYVDRPDGATATVSVHRRDLTADPTVRGVVSTLRDVTAEREFQRDLAYRASHDALTGLANSERFTEELHAGGDRGGRAVLFIDLDDFKAVNDTFGHEIGDGLLSTVARWIESCVRDGDVAARLGGDEFAVVMRGLRDSDAARMAAQRMSETLSRSARVGAITVDCQASIGLAYDDGSRDAAALLREADTALYSAKALGKGHWQQYREGMPIPARLDIDTRHRLERAVNAGTLRLRYQPIVELASNNAAGFEAFIHLDDGAKPIQTPQLIEAAEDTGLMAYVADWMLGQALSDVAKLNEPDNGQPHYVSVSLSARQLRQHDLRETVRTHLTAVDADPSLLVLEISEGLLVDGHNQARSFLADLRREGIRIAVDDYGTGHAPLSYLRNPGIDIVKIDQSFLVDLTSARSRVLLRAMTSLSSQLGLVQIAEGVRDAGIRDLLLEVGCAYGQGNLFAPAMPIDEAVTWTCHGQP